MAKNNPAQPHYRKKKYAASVGGLFVVLAAIGLVTVIMLCLRLTQGILDDTSEKVRFEKEILPVVMFDPVPFENVKDMGELFMLRCALWDTLLGENRSNYQYDPQARLMVPASDVDIHSAELFGPDIKLAHKTFGNVDVTYEYRDSTYFVPTTGETDFYTPSVDTILKKGDSYFLTVGYMPPMNVFTQIMTDDFGERIPEKFMLYELLKVKDHFQLIAVRDMPKQPGQELLPYGASIAPTEQNASAQAAPEQASSSAASEEASAADSSSEEASEDSSSEQSSSTDSSST